jgi:phage baseplate assembly protein W
MSTEILSDRNILNRTALVVSRRQKYSDLDLSLTLHPDFHDIIPLEDLDAVKNAVRNLILTNFYERPFQPFTAGNLQAFLFEPADRFTIISIKESIKNVLRRHEPRVDQVTVQVQDNSESNRYDITLGFRVISVGQTVSVSLQLQRIR